MVENVTVAVRGYGIVESITIDGCKRYRSHNNPANESAWFTITQLAKAKEFIGLASA